LHFGLFVHNVEFYEGAPDTCLVVLMRLLQHIERRHVSARQIHHVDVVPNSYKIVLKRFKSTKVELTGPVGGAVVSAEDGQNGQVSNRDLRYQRHYISERFDGILAYQSRGMRSQRIEVSQRNNVPLFIGVCDVFEHLLDENIWSFRKRS
jgi:hypothetical protein